MGTQTVGRFLRLSVGKVWGGCPGWAQQEAGGSSVGAVKDE